MSVSLRSLGMLRVAAVTPELKVADVAFNLAAIEAPRRKRPPRPVAGWRSFPELAVTGYTCGDLFGQPLLLDQAEAAVLRLAATSARLGMTLVVGVPLRQGGRLFNAAVVLSGGQVCGVVPKSFLPNSQEFYERRWFATRGRGHRRPPAAWRHGGAVRHRPALSGRRFPGVRARHRNLRGRLGGQPAER